MASTEIIIAIFIGFVASAILLVLPDPEIGPIAKLQSCFQDIAVLLPNLFPKETTLEATRESQDMAVERIFTSEELKAFDGSGGSPGLYLAIMGKVFDVQKGEKHYAPGRDYSFFAACDGSKAYISGDFTEKGLKPDVDGLSPKEMVALENWVRFFEKEYTYVGKVSGHFYDERGNPTSKLVEARQMIGEGKKLEDDEAAHQKRFPHCNSEWKQTSGQRVWCSTMSGGIKRDWTGVPRKLFNPETSKWRCACISEAELGNPHLRLYDNCDPKAISCKMDK